MRSILPILLACVASISGMAQSITLSNWNTVSSLRTVRSADVDKDGRIWAATTGGTLLHERETGVTTEYRNVNALQTLDCTSLSVDGASGNVYIGQSDGSLDIQLPNGTWKNVPEIRRATQYTRRSINDFAFRGDSVFIATDFGIALYNQRTGTFIETIDRIGVLQEKNRVSGICLHNDSVWISTDSGVAVAPLSASTLRLPSVWTNLGLAAGLDQLRVRLIRSDGTTLACYTQSTAYTVRDRAFIPAVNPGGTLNGLSLVEGRLAVSSPAGIFTAAGQLPLTTGGEIIGHAWKKVNAEEVLIVFIKDKAFGYSTNTELTMVNVNTPISNQFAHMSIDVQGGLWVATDLDPPRTGQGVGYFDGSTWLNITTATDTAVRSNSCYRVSSLPDGTTWAGTWGAGALRLEPTPSGVSVSRFDQRNSSLQGILVDPNFVLAADVALDRYGRTWMVNEQSATQLYAITKNDVWTGEQNCSDARSTIFRTMAVDGSGTVWAGGPMGAGIVAFNDRNTPDRGDDICNVVRISNSQLPDNAISVLRTDKSGGLWIGTSKGVAVISVPSSITNTSVPFVRRINALTNAVVNDIYVDALNNKWVATAGGVFVLNVDGTEVIATITKSNAPLLDDNVRTVVVNDKTGVAYFGTSNGCTTVQTSSVRPLDAFEIKCYPQPFSIQDGTPLSIDGLAADSDVRVLTLSGVLVKAIQARGRIATWDGTDVNGVNVPPGVYLINASSATTNTTGVAKITVRR